MAASLLSMPLWLMVQPAQACSCAGVQVPAGVHIPSYSEILANAEIVAVGTVTNVRPVAAVKDEFGGKSTEYESLVHVSDYIKGSGGAVVAVRHFRSGCSAFDDQTALQSYVFVLNRTDEELRATSKCDGTHVIEAADIQVASARLRQRLGSAANPDPQAAGRRSNDAWPFALAITLGSVGLAAMTFSLWRGTRRA